MKEQKMNRSELNLNVNDSSFLDNLLYLLDLIDSMLTNQEIIEPDFFNLLTVVQEQMENKIIELTESKPSRNVLEEWVNHFVGLQLFTHEIRMVYPIYNQ